MRFIGALLAMVGLAVVYFLGYKGLTVDQARTRLAKLLNLPGLNPPTPASGAGSSSAPAGGGGGGGSW